MLSIDSIACIGNGLFDVDRAADSCQGLALVSQPVLEPPFPDSPRATMLWRLDRLDNRDANASMALLIALALARCFFRFQSEVAHCQHRECVLSCLNHDGDSLLPLLHSSKASYRGTGVRKMGDDASRMARRSCYLFVQVSTRNP